MRQRGNLFSDLQVNLAPVTTCLTQR